MEDNIKISVSQASITKGVKDLSDLLHKQTAIKPEAYLPTLSFLNEYINTFAKANFERDSSVKYESIIIAYDKFAVIDGIEKIKKLLYSQTIIPAETYLVIFDQMDKFADEVKNSLIATNKQQETSQPKQEIEKQEQKNDKKSLAWLFEKGEKK